MISWLKGAKRVNDLHPGLFWLNPNLHPDESIRREDIYIERWRKMRAELLPLGPELVAFFGSNLDDGNLLHQERTGNTNTLTVNCPIASDVAASLGIFLGLKPESDPWRLMDEYRVVLTAHDIVYQRTAAVTHGGGLRFYRLQIPKFRGDTTCYLRHQWFVQEHNRVQWIIEVWHGAPDAYILTDCKSVSAIDLRLPALVRGFGPNVEGVWLDVLAASNEPGWTCQMTEQNVLNAIESRNLKKSDFDPTHFRYEAVFTHTGYR